MLWRDGSLMNSPINNVVIESRCAQISFFGWPCDATVETLRDAYMNEPDAAARRRIIDDLSKAAWASLPAILTGKYYNAYAWRAEVTGLIHATQLVFWNADKTR